MTGQQKNHESRNLFIGGARDYICPLGVHPSRSVAIAWWWERLIVVHCHPDDGTSKD